LHGVKFTTAMVRVDDDLGAAEHGLLAAVHEVIGVNAVLGMSLTLAVESGDGRAARVCAAELIVF
jgi:hypothetical protein